MTKPITLNLKKVVIPQIDLENQRKAILIFEQSLDVKRRKEAEAQRLLESIDAYLLGELGIELPEPEENTVQNRIFQRKFSEVSGGRFDPKFQLNFSVFQQLISDYKIVKLRNLLAGSPQYGANEEAIQGDPHRDTRYIRITDIDEFGNLLDSEWKTAKRIEPKYLLHDNDILFARSGATAGKCFIYKEQYGKAIFAGYLIRFLLDSQQILPDYLFYFTYTRLYKHWVKTLQRPSAQPNINSEEFKSLPIPLPPIAEQKRIIENIDSIRQKAKRLQHEAHADLEQAKHEVEALILGAA